MRKALFFALFATACAQPEYPNDAYREVDCGTLSVTYESGLTECHAGIVEPESYIKFFAETGTRIEPGTELFVFRENMGGYSKLKSHSLDGTVGGWKLGREGSDWSETRHFNGYEYKTFTRSRFSKAKPSGFEDISCVSFALTEDTQMGNITKITYGFYCTQDGTITPEKAEGIIDGLTLRG